jgi:hypothetical protein
MNTTSGITGEIILLNAVSASMLPSGGSITLEPIGVEKARAIIQGKKIISYIGHPATATVLGQLLGINVETNRSMFIATKPTIGILISIMERLPEGKILNEQELNSLVQQGKVKLFLVTIVPF